ncbi:hypothetical protein LCGC14_0388080 [marine sediment metagenome]|uniref:Uncharacterized protein n=1 Tax=marine sediment metagenome TaxID=412755 RepID=A0A0F9VMU1_9ZZZZ
MNVFEVDIWRSVYHGNEFSHTTIRYELVHALNEERAKRKITLAEERTYNSGSIGIRVTNEFIYRIKKTGTVTKQMFYVYSNGMSPRPVAQSNKDGWVKRKK